MRYLLLLLFLAGCATEPKCKDRIVITKCDVDHKEKVVCYKTIRCNQKELR